MSPLAAGNSLGRYELLLPVAKGGMAQVWAARLRGTRGFQKLVAIKTILPGALDSARLEQMFLAEAQLASLVHHPNVVRTLELGEHEGMLYLVMEWVEGEPVSSLMLEAIEHGGLPLPIAVNLIAQACQGLHAAHELRDDADNLLGVVHRDVSPQNLLVTLSGTAKLVDFGVAKATNCAGGLTAVGEVKGKFSYMAPEQVQAQEVDRRADIFALGILGYLLTTGRHPFRCTNPGETVKSIVSAVPPVPPTVFVADYPPAVEAVLMKALQKEPSRRFASADEMLGALEAALPQALEAGFQAQVAAYMVTVLGARSKLRRAAIRQAQQIADHQRSENGASSVGSLRAITLDSMTDSLLPVPGRASAAAPVLSAAEDSNPFAAPKRARRYAAGTIATVALVLVASSWRWAGSERSVAASSLVPAQTLATVSARPAPTPSAALSAPSAAALPAAPASARAWSATMRR